MTRTNGRARPIPARSCVACRTVRPKRELLRIVRTPDGRVVLDDGGRVAGRGAYVCRDPVCRSSALTRGAIARALGVPLTPEVRAALEAGVAAEAGARTTALTTTNPATRR